MALVISAPERVAPTVAQQIFVVGSAVAGLLGGIVLADKMAEVRDVAVNPVVIATTTSVIFTLGAALVLARVVSQGVSRGYQWR